MTVHLDHSVVHCFLAISCHGTKSGHIICRAQSKMTMWDFLFKKHEEIQDGNSRALNQVWALLSGGLCDCADCTPVSQALQAHTAQDAIQPTEKT